MLWAYTPFSVPYQSIHERKIGYLFDGGSFLMLYCIFLLFKLCFLHNILTAFDHTSKLTF